jgi:hypothetical protein
MEAIPRTPSQLPGEGSRNTPSSHASARPKGPKRGGGQSAPRRVVAPSATRKGKGRGTPVPTPGEGSGVGPRILSQDKIPMTDEGLAKCQKVWNCTKKHAQDAYPLTYMKVVERLYESKQREEERKAKEAREKEEAEKDDYPEGGEDYDDYIDWEAQDRGD